MHARTAADSCNYVCAHASGNVIGLNLSPVCACRYLIRQCTFERYNGILGNYKTKNRSIEAQLMRHFVQEMEIGISYALEMTTTMHIQ